jgi:hypothetical protein
MHAPGQNKSQSSLPYFHPLWNLQGDTVWNTGQSLLPINMALCASKLEISEFELQFLALQI